MDKQLALPTLTERIFSSQPETISAWVIWEMKRLGALDPGFNDEFEGQDCLGKAIFKIEAVPDAVIIRIGNHVQPLSVTYTPCGKGGRRPWWNCPACGARRGVLFLRRRNWGCRGCMGLPYRTQRMSRRDRAIEKATRLHTVLGGSGSLLDELPRKRPHGMRRRTYMRLRRQFAEAHTLMYKLTCQAFERLYGPDGPPFSEKPWPWRQSGGRRRSSAI